MARVLAVALGCVALALAEAGAQQVVPSQQVTTRVVVRAGPGTKSADVGSLRPGERLALVSAGKAWHRVRLEDGREGFVSAAWTVVVPEGWDVAAPAPAGVPVAKADRFDFAPEATLSAVRVTPAQARRGFFGSIAAWFRPPERVTIDLSSPALGESVRQHYDPRLPVAGLAHTSGQAGNFDVMLAIDVSASTSEFADTDVDGDGQARDDWKTPDSILAAQALAAAEFVRAVARLPGNREGRRIRVGVVTFAGDDAHILSEADRALRLDEADLLALARRDAELLAPLSRDYAATLAALAKLGRRTGAGMTDFAAGITRATVELARLEGAASEPRADAERVIYFLTDGKARLPYDRRKAERAAWRAAAHAERQGVRIHTFALGHDVVTGVLSKTVRRIARETGGACVELENPADVVPLLRATALSFVDRVRIHNRTTGQSTDYVTTGIDGSFYGEIPLAEGENELELVAELYGGREHTEQLRVRFEPVPREQRLAEELAEIRKENEALIEEIREKLREQLAREMAAVREASGDVSGGPPGSGEGRRGPGQGRELEVRIDRPAGEAPGSAP